MEGIFADLIGRFARDGLFYETVDPFLQALKLHVKSGFVGAVAKGWHADKHRVELAFELGNHFLETGEDLAIGVELTVLSCLSCL
jgi:hypothetical protein